MRHLSLPLRVLRRHAADGPYVLILKLLQMILIRLTNSLSNASNRIEAWQTLSVNLCPNEAWNLGYAMITHAEPLCLAAAAVVDDINSPSGILMERISVNMNSQWWQRVPQ